jgi:hypothetical protein
VNSHSGTEIAESKRERVGVRSAASKVAGVWARPFDKLATSRTHGPEAARKILSRLRYVQLFSQEPPNLECGTDAVHLVSVVSPAEEDSPIFEVADYSASGRFVAGRRLPLNPECRN